MKLKQFIILLVCFLSVTCKIFCEEIKSQEIIEIIPSSNDDIIKQLPIYQFCDNEVGLFINSFMSTIADFRFDDPIILISSTDNVPDNSAAAYYNIELPEECVLLQLRSWDPGILKEAKGAIPLPNNKYGILLSDSSEWLEELNVKGTDQILSIYYGKSYLAKDDDVVFIEHMATSYYIWAVLEILDDNKVNPLIIYNVDLPIQNCPDLNSKFDWIEQFYREHGLPAGCGYYEQENLTKELLPVQPINIPRYINK